MENDVLGESAPVYTTQSNAKSSGLQDVMIGEALDELLEAYC